MEDQQKIIMYSMPSCGYCKKMKDELDKESIQYEERAAADYESEWGEVKALTKSAVFPTFVVGDNYILPNRDFQSPEDGIQQLRYYQSLPPRTQTMYDVIELLKNSIHMIKIIGDKVHELEGKIDNLNKREDMQKVRQQIIDKQTLQASELKKSRDQRKKMVEVVKEKQKSQAIDLEAYVQTNLQLPKEH